MYMVYIVSRGQFPERGVQESYCFTGQLIMMDRREETGLDIVKMTIPRGGLLLKLVVALAAVAPCTVHTVAPLQTA